MDRILIILKKENGPRASSAPALGLNTIVFKHVYWYMQQTQVSVYRTIGPLVLCFQRMPMCSENKDTDQLYSYCICFRIGNSPVFSKHVTYMSHVMRKPTFCIYMQKQSNCEADQCPFLLHGQCNFSTF